MGLVNSALQIGRSALLSYQGALQVIGNNIANAGRPGYTRQSAVLTGIPGPILGGGFQPGNGVALTALQRHVDEALQARLRTANSDKESALVEHEALAQIESIVNELSDTDLSTLLNEFFGAWADLQTTPHDAGARRAVLTSGQALAREVQRQRSNVFDMVGQLNDRIAEVTTRANELAAELAELNVQIVADSAGGGGAGALRDRRDSLLTELSQIVNVTTREQPSGAINVYVGNEPLVFDGISRGLATEVEVVDDIERVNVVFADNLAPVSLRGGQLEGLIASRDAHVAGQLDALNQLARALIYDVNRVHSCGQGLQWFDSVTGTYAAADTAAALNDTAAGYDFPPTNGSFLLKVRDAATGTISTTLIEVDLDGITPPPDTTLDSLRADIDAVPNVTATIQPDGRLRIEASSGFTFSFAEDSSGVLAALGINTFFEGRDARTMAVNDVVENNTQLIAAATDALDGDGTNAGRLAALGTAASDTLNGASLFDFYGSIVGNIAVMSSAANAGAEAADVIVTSLEAQRESISGVSLDEEAVSLAKFERSFQAAARYVTIVDELISEMLTMVR